MKEEDTVHEESMNDGNDDMDDLKSVKHIGSSK